MSVVVTKRSIPFIPQRTIEGHWRTCGAAALAMGYASFGLDVPLEDIWPRLSLGLSRGEAVGSHRLAADALARGMSAVVLRARDPSVALETVLKSRRVCIANHRLDNESFDGHFSVVVDADEQHVVVHNPYSIAYERIHRATWQSLWGSETQLGEHSGYVLVAMAPPELTPDCDELICPRCRTILPLASDLGVSAGEWDDCWECLFCAFCDASLRCG
ncbi:hypothetical protein [Aeoliella sp.]|uniref:hypothetical protein n=1 Tax=Aeoliella sp. TaxID=2795800 RepID=UPI003CCBC80D